LHTKNGCNNEHIHDEIIAAEQFFANKKYYQQRAIAYVTGEGKIELFRFDKIPVHLSEAVDLNHDELYEVEIKELNEQGNSYGIKVISSAGKIGEFDTEQRIVEKYQEKYFKAPWLGLFA
jgi:hypothetical protein